MAVSPKEVSEFGKQKKVSPTRIKSGFQNYFQIKLESFILAFTYFNKQVLN